MAETRKKTQKRCGVCGDHALGSNFNAITCESCKAFFRRNALKTKEFKCPFEGNCKVDVITRRFCQKCRLKKCFDIGMKKEWIMTDEEKKAKREKIEKNRLKRSGQHHDDPSPSPDIATVKVESPDPPLNHTLLSPSSAMSPLTPQTPGNMGVSADVTCKSHVYSHQPLTPSDCEYSPPTKIMAVEDVSDIYSDTGLSTYSESLITEDDSRTSSVAHFSAPSKSQSPVDQPEPDVDKEPATDFEDLKKIKEVKKEVDLSQCSASTSASEQSVQHDAIKLPDSVFLKSVALKFIELPIRDSSSDSKKLSLLEKTKLEELVVANKVLNMPLACGITDPSLLDVINMTDHAIRRLIKMSKKIAAFKNLCQNDQIALLKGGCTELMILRSVMSYDPERECWNGPRGPKRMSIKVDILKEAKGNVYEEHKRFINSFLPKWRADENIMLILSGIALFTPERPNLVHREVIKLEQCTYYYLLYRYLETVYTVCEAKDAYLRLMHRIEELHILNENHVRVYLDVNPKDVEPLLIEIFDLKH